MICVPSGAFIIDSCHVCETETFWDHPGELVPEESFFWTLWTREDNKRQTHQQSRKAPLHPVCWLKFNVPFQHKYEPLHPDQSAIHLHQPPIFMPDALLATTIPIYPGLGQAQEYVGLHTSVAWFSLS